MEPFTITMARIDQDYIPSINTDELMYMYSALIEEGTTKERYPNPNCIRACILNMGQTWTFWVHVLTLARAYYLIKVTAFVWNGGGDTLNQLWMLEYHDTKMIINDTE